jgi:hypothetical protein
VTRKRKPKLVDADEERWQLVRLRSAALGQSISDFVDDALAAHLIATEDSARKAVQPKVADFYASVSNYAASSDTQITATALQADTANTVTYATTAQLDEAVERVLAKHSGSLKKLASSDTKKKR